MEKMEKKLATGLKIGLFVLACLIAVGSTRSAEAVPLTFVNDYSGWLTASGGAANTIDFETLPDGSPSVVSTPITDAFNYTSQGATISSITNDIVINGNNLSGFGIHAGSPFLFGTPTPTNIRADLVTPVQAFGIFFPGGTTLSIFDELDNLLGTASYFSGGDNFFLGFVSDTPIAYAISERGGSIEYWQSVTFSAAATPVPEPATILFFGTGLVGLVGIRLRRRNQ